MASSSHPLSLFLLLLMAATSTFPAVRANDAGNIQKVGLTQIHLYMHEITGDGPDATIVTSVPSPVGPSASFGSLKVMDNELRSGPDRESSELVGRFQALMTGAGLQPNSGYLTTVTFLFTAGEYSGSMLSVQGTAPSFSDSLLERAIVGGTGRFRLARGYLLSKTVSNPTPESSVYQMDLSVLMYEPETSMNCEQGPQNEGHLEIME